MAANQAFHPTPESLAALRGRLGGGAKVNGVGEWCHYVEL